MRPILAVLLVAATVPAGAAPSAGRAAFVETFRCEIVDRLDQIHAGDRSTSRGRFISVSPRHEPDAYVQCIFAPGDARMLCEAASGAYRLRPGEAGPAAPVGRPEVLRALGFRPNPAGGNDVQELDLGTPPGFDRVAELILTALHDAYDVRLPVTLTIRTPKARRDRAACAPVG